MRVIGMVFVLAALLTAPVLADEKAPADATAAATEAAAAETPAEGVPAAVGEAETALPESPELAEVKALAAELGAFDLKTWRVVAKYWDQQDKCLELVDAHLSEHRDHVKALFKEAKTLSCRVDQSGHVALSTKTQELGKAFNEAYVDKTADITKIKKMLADDDATRELSLAVRRRENEFRKEICTEIARERKIERLRPKPLRGGTKKESAGS